jgi:hypothetical protein
MIRSISVNLLWQHAKSFRGLFQHLWEVRARLGLDFPVFLTSARRLGSFA